MTRRMAVPVVLLIVSLTGMARFSQGLRLVDTIGLFASGALAGSALAQIAINRKRR